MTPEKLTTATHVPDELLRDSAFDLGALSAARIGDGWIEGRTVAVQVEPAPPTPDHVVGGARECCDRCGKLTETEPFQSWKGPLAICAECWSDAVMEE